MRHKTGMEHNVEMEQFLDDIRAVIRDGQDLLRAGVGGVKERARAGANATHQFVEEYPYRTMGLAFGAGILAGVMVAGWFLSRREGE